MRLIASENWNAKIGNDDRGWETLIWRSDYSSENANRASIKTRVGYRIRNTKFEQKYV